MNASTESTQQATGTRTAVDGIYSDSLKAWEASLGLQNVSAGSGPNVEVIGLTLHSPGRPDIVVDLTKKEDLKKSPINIKVRLTTTGLRHILRMDEDRKAPNSASAFSSE